MVAVQQGSVLVSLKNILGFSTLLGFPTAAGQWCCLLLQLFLSPQAVTGAVQPHPGHRKVSVCPSSVVALFWMLPGMLEVAGPAGRAAGWQHWECSPCTGATLLSRQIYCQMAPAISSKLHWDFTLEAACKLNKYCNIFVRQLY